MTDLRIRFVNADSALVAQDSFLSLLVKRATGLNVEVVAEASRQVDLQFTSVQFSAARRIRQLLAHGRQQFRRSDSAHIDARWDRVNPRPQGRARAHIWFTGENLRPPSTGWDGTLSFDVDSLAGINAYLPLWWYTVGVLGPANSIFMDPPPELARLLSGRNARSVPDRFAVALINHPHPMRFHAIQALQQFGSVDVFGRAVGHTIPNKASLAGRYKFMLCFENDLYPGYVTEKAIEAWTMGTVPLWWGSDPAGYLNPRALVNAADHSTIEEFAETVSRVSRDESGWREMFNQPLVLRSPDLEPALKLIRRACSL